MNINPHYSVSVQFDPIDDTLLMPIDKNHNIETVAWRMLASLNIVEPKKVIQTTIHLLLGISDSESLETNISNLLDKKVSTFAKKYFQSVLNAYGMKPSAYQKKELLDGTVLNLVKNIIDHKREGLTPHQYYQLMINLLRGLEKEGSLTQKESSILEQVRTQVCNAYNHVMEWGQLYYLSDQMNKNPAYSESYYQLIKEIAEKQADIIDLLSGKEVGSFVFSGWPGHFIGVEIKKEGSYYTCSVANAGFGQNYFHFEMTPNQHQSINVYQISSRKKMVSFLEELIDCRMQGSGSKGNAKQHNDRFYRLFKGLSRHIYLGLPSRPTQTVGNCGLRNQEELFFWICQRNNLTSLANKFQEYVKKRCIKECDHYPLLKQEILAAAKKPLIYPLAHQHIKQIIA